jgi:tetraacyldisaccharide 4'-kinase
MARPHASQRLQAAWATRGPLAVALWPLSALYGLLRRLHRAFVRVQTLPVPVVVVGNYVAGGAGKTPTVIALASLLRRHGYHPGIVSRGYGRDSPDVLEVQADTPPARCGDEPRLLQRRLGLPVVVGRDRVAAVRALLARHADVDVVISDDGLQHRRLPRVAQVLVFDERGTGNGWLLPAGPLREPLPDRVPEGSVVLYNAPAPSTAWPGHLARRMLAGAVSLADWWAGRPASHAALQALRGRPVLAAAGMARPERFFDMLAASGLTVTRLPLPDHHDYATLPWPAETAEVIVTEKDAVKLAPRAMGTARVWVAPLDFDTGPAFEDALLKLLPPPRPRTSHGHPIA